MPPDTLKLHDILYVLFRHKWKIVFCSILGLAVAGALLYVTPPVYESTAKLLVRYVMDSRTVDTLSGNQQIRTPDSRGDNIINSEIEIMTSWDLATEVAQNVGPARILGPGTDQTNRTAAAATLLRNLSVTVPRNSNVILISLKHSDPDIAYLALGQLLDRYLEKHLEVHRAIGAYDFLQRQTDQLRTRLASTEDELQRLKQQARIISLDETKRDLTARLGRLQQSILDEETLLAGHRARLLEIEKWTPTRLSVTSTNGTNNLAPPEPAILERYRLVTIRIASLQQSEFSLLTAYTADHPQVRLLRNQIDVAESEKRQLESDHPALLSTAPTSTGTITGDPTQNPLTDPIADRAYIAAAEARIATLRTQLDATLAEATKIDSLEKGIVDLQRRKDLEEQNFTYFSANLEKARIDEALDPTKVPNISKVQEPSAPRRASWDLIPASMIAALGIALGIGLALLIDLVLDPSIKRPLDIETRLRIPLMLSIPFVGRNGKSTRIRFLSFSRGHRRSRRHPPRLHAPPLRKSLPQGKEDGGSKIDSAHSKLETRHSKLDPASDLRPPPSFPSFIRPFCDALRDRIILYFQLKNMHHKPKLVAVTGCEHGSGVTTIASGLAAALSETGDGKVLLVDMNVNTTQIHPFYQGHLVPHLTEIMDPGATRKAEIAENLYVASATGTNGHSAKLIPKKFYDLIPRLKASDFDYIIFDMPPVNETSATMALAGFMDQVLLVVEANKSSRAQIKRAHSILISAQASVVGVFNKSRSQGPAWLVQDL
jgi:uncharacterized protein involved in exopolysaccharide biosynthesis/Mrp family chromosome partitioning ATPase